MNTYSISTQFIGIHVEVDTTKRACDQANSQLYVEYVIVDKALFCRRPKRLS